MEVLEKEIYRRYLTLLENNAGISLNPLGVRSHAQPKEVSFAELLDKYDVFCFDGYGTLYNRGDFVYPGARQMFRSLREAGKQVRLITNAASDVDRVLAADAAKRGFDFTEAETISSGSLLKDLVRKLRDGAAESSKDCASDLRSGRLIAGGQPRTFREVYYIGRETGKNVLAACGIRAVSSVAYPEEPVVAISSAKETAETYARAVEILRRPGAILLVLNSDAWAPKTDGSREPVSGALSERLRRDSMCEANGGEGCTTFYLGKPFPAIWEKARASLDSFCTGASNPRVIMLGDTLGTDILGARIAGFDSCLLVGRNQPAEELSDDEASLGIRPDYYLREIDVRH